MANEPDFKDLTEEQKTQLKALESKMFKRSLRCSARNCLALVGASVVVGILNVKYFQSPTFLFATATANTILFIRQIRLDFLEENRIAVEELQKIFK